MDYGPACLQYLKTFNNICMAMERNHVFSNCLFTDICLYPCVLQT